MYIDPAPGMVFRPPSEANSLILRITIGCSHNACSFCAMYRSVAFRIRSLAEIQNLIQAAAHDFPDTRRIFLADGNALVVNTEKLLRIMQLLHDNFPRLTRITLYGAPKDILRKSTAELTQLKNAGLKIIYLGLESGDDEVLTLLNKGVSAAQMIEAGQKVISSGIKLSLMVLLGAGGTTLSRQHAIHTGAVVSAIEPTMLSALTLMLPQGCELRRLAEQGHFVLPSPSKLMEELSQIIDHIFVTKPCIFRSNHVSNLLPLSGTFPRDKEKLFEITRQMIEQFKDVTLPPYNDTGNF